MKYLLIIAVLFSILGCEADSKVELQQCEVLCKDHAGVERFFHWHIGGYDCFCKTGTAFHM